jgi:hypothetical protein
MEFVRNIAFRIVPPLPGRWGVLQSPVAAVAACKINVTSDINLNRFADAIAPDFTELRVSNSVGNAQILWRAGGTGSQWAIIRIGNTACTERLEKFVMLRRHPQNWDERDTEIGLSIMRSVYGLNDPKKILDAVIPISTNRKR